MAAAPAAAAPEAKFKVVLLGEGAVGKTSLFLRYCNNSFNEAHNSTIQASFHNRRLNLDGKRVILNIWDTAGQERFHALGPIYYRDANGALLVYDICDQDSFQKVKNWVKELRMMLGAAVEICVVGNKADMEKNRTVPLQEAETYAATVGAKHYSTSAKFNKGVDELFLDLSKRMLANASKIPTPPPPSGSGSLASSQKGYGATGGTLKLGGDEATTASSKPASGTGCCG